MIETTFIIIGLIICAILFGVVGTKIATSKGNDAVEGFITGFIFGLFGLLILHFSKNNIKRLRIISDDIKKCPYCFEYVKNGAIKCRYCESDISNVKIIISDSAKKLLYNFNNATEGEFTLDYYKHKKYIDELISVSFIEYLNTTKTFIITDRGEKYLTN